MRSVWLSLALLLAALALMILAPGPASAQQPGAVLIWPVNPVIEADKQAAALWLENPGKTPVTLQVRIYAWAQTDGKNVYADQQAIIGTPPIVTIAPGSKQLVRLTRSGPAPSGSAPFGPRRSGIMDIFVKGVEMQIARGLRALRTLFVLPRSG